MFFHAESCMGVTLIDSVDWSRRMRAEFIGMDSNHLVAHLEKHAAKLVLHSQSIIAAQCCCRRKNILRTAKMSTRHPRAETIQPWRSRKQFIEANMHVPCGVLGLTISGMIDRKRGCAPNSSRWTAATLLLILKDVSLNYCCIVTPLLVNIAARGRTASCEEQR